MKDYYSILGIPRYASEQTIKEAYRRLAKRWHPDANNGDEDAQRIMQDLNRAKEVLFNPDTREEYQRVLEMQDTLSADNIKRLRKTFAERRFRDLGTQKLKPFATGKFILLMSVISIAIGIAIFRLVEINTSKQAASDPIENIIRRNQQVQLFPDTTRDTIKVPAVSPERLLQMASLLAMLHEYKSAAKYWEKYLDSDRHNLDVATSLMLAYLRRDEYDKALRTIRDHVTGDTNLIVIYSTLADYFHDEKKFMDADNAYEEVAELGKKVENPSEKIRKYISNAEKRMNTR